MLPAGDNSSMWLTNFGSRGCSIERLARHCAQELHLNEGFKPDQQANSWTWALVPAGTQALLRKVDFSQSSQSSQHLVKGQHQHFDWKRMHPQGHRLTIKSSTATYMLCSKATTVLYKYSVEAFVAFDNESLSKLDASRNNAEKCRLTIEGVVPFQRPAKPSFLTTCLMTWEVERNGLSCACSWVFIRSMGFAAAAAMAPLKLPAAILRSRNGFSASAPRSCLMGV